MTVSILVIVAVAYLVCLIVLAIAAKDRLR